MAGMPQKMLEHLLETRLDARNLSARDEDIIRPYSSATDMFLDDFLLVKATLRKLILTVSAL